MTNTERKLDEARYFLKKLNPNYPFFDYVLSAYLNAARSTTWIMRYEFHNINGWEEWFGSCKISEEESSLLKRINDLRILSTKKSGIKTEFFFMDSIIPDEECYPVIDKMLHDLDGRKFEFTISDASEEDTLTSSSEEVYAIKGTVKLAKEKSDISRESIYNLCKSYFMFLEGQVKDCVMKFKNGL